MIRAIIFDLDGVLVDADEWHFDALNMALADHDFPVISWREHLAIYKGLPTARKLEIYADRHSITVPPTVGYQKRWWTTQTINFKCKPRDEIVDMMKTLRDEGYTIAVASNAIRDSVNAMIDHSGLATLVDLSLSNEDIAKPKPDPAIYKEAFAQLDLGASECLIVEDSDVGRTAARASRAHTCFVDGPADVNYYRVMAAIEQADRVNVVIPAAGAGKRFSEAGYIYPKPLIRVANMSMIELVLDNLKVYGDPIVLMQREHIRRYAVDDWLDARLVAVDGMTEGAACTVLLAKSEIDNENELVIANSDQLLQGFEYRLFVGRMRDLGADGGIMTFPSADAKWSYARADSALQVLEVAEKRVISDRATTGVYYFRRGSDFVAAAERMIEQDVRTNGEFYVCPVFNELIAQDKRIYVFDVPAEAMVGMGTPEDLETAIAPRAA